VEKGPSRSDQQDFLLCLCVYHILQTFALPYATREDRAPIIQDM
jgi:hypothetical protein